MSCNCGGGHQPLHGPGHDCNLINHAFDPNPPAFYGTWNHLHGHDATSRVSVCQPGVHSGLYKKSGPLNCQCSCATMYTLTGIQTTARIVLDVKLSYNIADMNKIVTITPGELYTFTYLEDGQLKTCSGKVTNIYKVNELEESTNLYKIRVDCSSNYNNHVAVFKTDQIRGVDKYSIYAGEDTIITNGYHEYGTTIAQVIKDAIVVDAELDSEKNIIKGTIIAGTLEFASTMDGVCVGTNSNSRDVLITGVVSTNGEIAGGTILNGIVRSGDIDGETDEATGIVIHATIKGIIGNAVIVNSKVSGVQVAANKGTIIDPVIQGTTVYNATVSGDDMVTTGGITIGNLTTGGVTTGGTAVGTIDGKSYSITGGTTTPTKSGAGTGESLTTSGGVLTGGEIIGGTRIGNAIYGATIKGGVVHNGVTTGGDTSMEISVKNYSSGTGARMIPGGTTSNTTPIGRIVSENPNYNHVAAVVKKENRWDMNSYDLVLATDRATHTQLYTNFGRATIQEVDDLQSSIKE